MNPVAYSSTESAFYNATINFDESSGRSGTDLTVLLVLLVLIHLCLDLLESSSRKTQSPNRVNDTSNICSLFKDNDSVNPCSLNYSVDCAPLTVNVCDDTETLESDSIDRDYYYDASDIGFNLTEEQDDSLCCDNVKSGGRVRFRLDLNTVKYVEKLPESYFTHWYSVKTKSCRRVRFRLDLNTVKYIPKLPKSYFTKTHDIYCKYDMSYFDKTDYYTYVPVTSFDLPLPELQDNSLYCVNPKPDRRVRFNLNLNTVEYLPKHVPKWFKNY